MSYILSQVSVKNSLAPGVTTQEVTHGDSNWLRQQRRKETAVAIRKQTKSANGYRFRAGCVIERFCSVTYLSTLPRKIAHFLAPGVATQEATHGDSNWLKYQSVNGTAVAIRKPAVRANGYRASTKKSYFLGFLRHQPPPSASLQAGKGNFLERNAIENGSRSGGRASGHPRRKQAEKPRFFREA